MYVLFFLSESGFKLQVQLPKSNFDLAVRTQEPCGLYVLDENRLKICVLA